jgi:hypothetical protein
LALFIGILSRSFRGLGTARKFVEGNRAEEWFLWCLGAALFANVVGWFGCSYMAQMQMALFPLLAMISVAIFEATQTAAVPAEIQGRVRLPPLAEPAGTQHPIGQTR